MSSLKQQQQTLLNWVILLSALSVAFVLVLVFLFFKRRQTFSLFDSNQRDELTQCYRRKHGLIKAQNLIETAQANQQNIAVIICNIDHMNAVNENYGFDTGDILLQSFANTMSGFCGHHDLVMRREEDEFMMVLSDCTSLHLAELVRDIHHTATEITIDNQLIISSLSSGCSSLGDNDSDDATQLLTRLIDDADYGLNAAKASGGGCSFYSYDKKLSSVTVINEASDQPESSE